MKLNEILKRNFNLKHLTVREKNMLKRYSFRSVFKNNLFVSLFEKVNCSFYNKRFSYVNLFNFG